MYMYSAYPPRYKIHFSNVACILTYKNHRSDSKLHTARSYHSGPSMYQIWPPNIISETVKSRIDSLVFIWKTTGL